MVKEELVKRSPLRIFEKTIHGGLKPGQIGILASRKGVGKTACLVHIATDKLFNNKHILHVSFSPRVDHIVEWYEDIFKEIAKKRDLEHAIDVHDEIIRNRVIMNFSNKGSTIESVLKSLRAMISDGNFPADTLIIDGFDFYSGSSADFELFRVFAVEQKLTIWFAASLQGDDPFDKDGFPVDLEPYEDLADIVIAMRYQESSVQLSLVKEGDTHRATDMHLQLDPRTMLIVEA